jgi:uncharacterized repeat protein (TIGR01451 family)
MGTDLSIIKTHFSPGQHCSSNNNCGNNDKKFEVGQQLTSIISVSNSAQTDAVEIGNPVVVTDIIPVGLSDIHAYGQDWNIKVSDEYSPALVIATYAGSYPIWPGTAMPPIYVNGTLTQDAVPSLTDSAVVDVAGDVNNVNNIATDTAYVLQSNQHHNNDHQRDNSQHHNNNQHHKKDQQHPNNDSNSSNNNNSNNSSSSRSSYPILPYTGSDPFAT